MPSQENIVHTTPVEAPPVLKIGIFFDGTGNDNQKKNKDSLSNVWYLYDMHKGDGKDLGDSYALRKFYQRGVGSESDGLLSWAVDTAGNAGGYGAAVRFDNAIYYIEQYIIQYADKTEGALPSTIQLDVFGFSRGAAMARHFVNCIKQNYFDFKDPDINEVFSANNIFINFLGVFDTVGSFNIAGDNDDFGFSFHIKPSWIESKAVHIYALNEYRWGFDQQALTQKQDSNYPIDIIEGNFIEIGLPGAHSDIGGSYSYNDEDSIQFANNALLACPPLALMAKHAIENGVSLVEELSDQARKDAANAIKKDGVDGTRSYDEMIESYNLIIPYIQNEKLRPPVGLWREHIALVDIYKYKLKKINKRRRSNSDYYDDRQRKIDSLEKKIREAHNLVQLSEQSLMTSFEKEYGTDSNDKFNSFKSNYDILYQKYMHRSHYPFNETFGMGKQDADENDSWRDRSLTDDRPHRDIFSNQYKDFEKINIKRTQSKKQNSNKHSTAQTAPEFNILVSNIWIDPNAEDSTL
jgi:hypothetical protein